MAYKNRFEKAYQVAGASVAALGVVAASACGASGSSKSSSESSAGSSSGVFYNDSCLNHPELRWSTNPLSDDGELSAVSPFLIEMEMEGTRNLSKKVAERAINNIFLRESNKASDGGVYTQGGYKRSQLDEATKSFEKAAQEYENENYDLDGAYAALYAYGGEQPLVDEYILNPNVGLCFVLED